MPLRCRNSITGEDMHAFDLEPAQWLELTTENRHEHHLFLPCCHALVVLKRSRRGTQFFAHKAKGGCTTAPETEAHLRLKRMAAEAARAHGWDAATEVSGTTPDGEQWVADVYAQRGAAKVAVEIQWSSQTDMETLSRQARYARSGVRGLWILRQPGFPVCKELPAAGVKLGANGRYLAALPDRESSCEVQTLPIEAFLDAAFSGNLKFGLPEGYEASVSVWGNDVPCWKCKHQHNHVITKVEVEYGPYSVDPSIPDLTDHPKVWEIVKRQLPSTFASGLAIKRRYSRTQERTYLSNGCVSCGALFGQWFNHEYIADDTKVCEFTTQATAEWCAAISETCEHHLHGWGVYRRV